jgi:hypothetical protein
MAELGRIVLVDEEDVHRKARGEFTYVMGRVVPLIIIGHRGIQFERRTDR